MLACQLTAGNVHLTVTSGLLPHSLLESRHVAQHLLVEYAQNQPAKAAVITNEGNITYGELEQPSTVWPMISWTADSSMEIAWQFISTTLWSLEC